MKELNNNMRLETPAVAKLIDKMMEQGTTYEDFEKVLAYALSAWQLMTLRLVCGKWLRKQESKIFVKNIWTMK